MCRDVPRPDAHASAAARNAGQGASQGTRLHGAPRLGRGGSWGGSPLTGVSTVAPQAPQPGLWKHGSGKFPVKLLLRHHFGECAIDVGRDGSCALT